jgi:class 3 adenylate cyclase
MSALHTYLPQDRLRALGRGETLPDRASGAALFADISGFTPLTEALTQQLGSRRGPAG